MPDLPLCVHQALEREAAEREAHTVAAGLEAAEARGRCQRLEVEVARLQVGADRTPSVLLHLLSVPSHPSPLLIVVVCTAAFF